MTVKYISIRQLCYAVISAIASHPLIKNPPIYYPVLDSEPLQVKITKYRSYGGIELLNIGDLVCAVYPMYTPRNVKTGNPTLNKEMKSISYTPFEIGNYSHNSNTLEKVNIKLVIELHYHDVSIGSTPITINHKYITPNTIQTYPDSDVYVNTDLDATNPLLYTNFLEDKTKNQNLITQDDSVLVDINPAEDLLRDYMELLRIVLNQKSIYPFKVNHSYISSIDFPTSNWLEDGKNVYFHLAYMIYELELYLPNQNFIFPLSEPVESVQVDLSKL